MIYLIQDNLFREFHQESLISALDKFGLEYEIFKLKASIDEIEFQTNRKDVFVFGAVKSAHISKKYNWCPGSFYNENHDYIVYSKYYLDNMLNWDSKVQKISDPVEINGPFFARPTGDNKLFKGEVFENSKLWDVSVSYYLNYNKKATGDEMVQISSVKNIMQEYRCFVVKGEVITSSMYKLGDVVLYKRCWDDDIIEFANNMCTIYQPAEAFVIDICRTEEGLKIVEINCINCSGFYDIDIQKLILSLEENF